MTTNSNGLVDQAAIGARIDRLPFSRYMWTVVIIAGLAWFTEALSIGSLGVSIPALKDTFHIDSSQIGLLVASQTFGVVLGLIPAGRLADSIGRKKVLIYGIVWYSVFTFACGLVPNFSALLIARFLAGLGMGAVFPLPYTIVCELVPKNRRAVSNGVMDAFLSVGYFIAPLLGFLIFPAFSPEYSWRVFFIIAASPILYVALIHFKLPESPRWLARKGRKDEAERIMQGLEEATRRSIGRELEPPATSAKKPDYSPALTDASHLSQIFGPRLIKRTVVRTISAAATWFMFYTVMTYLPLIFTGQGYKLSSSLLFTAIITGAAIPGKLLNGYVGEIFGRRAAYAIFMGLAGVGALMFGIGGSLVGIIAYACVMSFFGTGVFPALKMSLAEQYPLQLRATGAATIEALGRLLGGVVGGYAVPVLLHRYGVEFSFVTIAVAAFIGVALELTMTIETRNKTVEELENAV
jgi:putative MFS transporter